MKFSELANLSHERVEEIKRKGSVVIKDIVPDEQAAQWKEDLRVFVQENPTVVGKNTPGTDLISNLTIAQYPCS